MRIAFVYDVPYPWHKGGIEQIFAIEVEELAKEHEVHFFTLRWPGMKREFTKDGVHYHAFGNAHESNVYRHGRRSIREAFVFSLYTFALFGSCFDAVVTDEFPVLQLLPIKLYCRLTNCRLVIRIAEIWDKQYWISYLGGFLGRLASAYSRFVLQSPRAQYVTLTSLTRQKLMDIGIPKKRISIFAPVLDKAIEKVPTQKRGRTIFFSGRFIKEKRIDKWLEVMRKVIDKDSAARGLIIGNGAEQQKIEATMHNLGLGSKVRLVDFYKQKAHLWDEISKSSALLHMSEREGLSIIALESITLGTPVVVPDYSPIPDEVKSMCTVVREGMLPAKLEEIMRSKDKSRFIKNRENLSMFSPDGIRPFYRKLLAKPE